MMCSRSVTYAEIVDTFDQEQVLFSKMKGFVRYKSSFFHKHSSEILLYSESRSSNLPGSNITHLSYSDF